MTRQSRFRSALAMFCLIAVAALLAGCIAAVPDVRGMSVGAATKAIQPAGLVLGPVTRVSHPSAPVGTVVKQTPSAGGSASRYSEMALQVSTGPERPQVPDVVGKAEKDAVSAIEAAGFALTLHRKAAEAASGTVVAQEPSGGAVANGAPIEITVSVGPGVVQVPDIHGIIDPDPALKKAGLRGEVIAVHGPIEPDAAGIGEAYRQRPSAGTWVPKGTTVSYHSWWESQ